MAPSSVPKRLLAWSAAAAALAAVFVSWLQPGVVFDLATRLWSCFG
ncbi:MAG TPA: hypothetical protein VNV16_03245 [Methylibium sp.]|nr:hypothetical protein [Methylibium sp.]